MSDQPGMAPVSVSMARGAWPFWRADDKASRAKSSISSLGVFAIGMILLFAGLAVVVVAFGPGTYSGVDGKFNQDLVTTYLAFGRPFVVNTPNPLEGVFSQLYPLNIWLNPGFATFLIFDHNAALVASTAVFLLIYCFSIYWLARTVDASEGVAIIGAQLGVFVFPPLYHLSGLFSNFDLAPHASLTVALFTLLLCLLLSLRDVSWRTLAIGVALSTMLMGYVVYNDPLTMGVIGFSFSVPYVMAILEGRRPGVIGLRILVLVVTGAILYALGLVDYVLAMDHYTARYFFRDEFFRPQVPDFVSTMFDFPNAGVTYAFLVPGWLAGLLFCRGRPLLLPVMATVNFIWIVAYGSVYVFSGVHWFAPLPLYLEEYTIHIAGLGAVAGWSALLWRLVRWLGFAWRRDFVGPRVTFMAAIAAAAIVPLALAIYGRTIPDSMYGVHVDPWVDEPE
ncbi:MAG: hypothetical protein WBD95_02070, partial [Xanthobacteraceae bacterium]